MKRSQDLSQTHGNASPAAKKFKATPPESPGPSVPDANGPDGGWTKVEKRKAKKVRKVEGKLDVCVLCFGAGDCCVVLMFCYWGYVGECTEVFVL